MKFKILTLLFGLVLFSFNSEKSEPKNQESNKDKNFALQQTKSSNHFNFEIGKVVNNKKVITANVNELKTNWSKFISDYSTLKLSYTSLEIIENDEGLFLKGVDKNNRASSIIALVVEEDIIYEALSDTGGECTVTCSGCENTDSGSSNEGTPHKGDNGYYCTSCSQGTCTKSTTCTDSSNSILQNK